jgi:predicted phosphodiesterase
VKIRLLSDLHLEGYRYYYEYAGEDIVVLAGDIHTQGRHDFILDQIPTAVQILFVAGNHEYYGAVFETANEYFKDLENKYSNFKFLNNESASIRDVEFFGGTMFTNWELDNDVWTAKQRAKDGIADFEWISKIGRDGQERRWNTDDHLQEHLAYTERLVQWKNKLAEKRVVISHFVPHPEGSDPKFAGSALNPYFISNMEQYMTGVDVWLYGHTHSSCDKVINGCRLVCNPRGYGTENAHGFINDLIVEV